MHYTSRQDGVLADKVNQELNSQFTNLMQLADQPAGLSRLFSLRHEFVSEWNAFAQVVTKNPATIALNIAYERFPFFCLGRKITIQQIDIILTQKTTNGIQVVDPDDLPVKLQSLEGRSGSFSDIPLRTFAKSDLNLNPIQPGKKIQLSIDSPPTVNIDIEDMIMVCHYTL